MELDKLRESSEKSGVKELWARDMSAEVKETWQKAQEVLGKGKKERPLICMEFN